MEIAQERIRAFRLVIIGQMAQIVCQTVSQLTNITTFDVAGRRSSEREAVLTTEKWRVRVVIAVAMACPVLAYAEDGRPVTASDLSGRTVCWSDGWHMTYARDGRYFGTREDKPKRAPGPNDHQLWSISEPGVVEINDGHRERYLQIVVLQDGRLERHWDVGPYPGGHYLWGTVCN